MLVIPRNEFSVTKSRACVPHTDNRCSNMLFLTARNLSLRPIGNKQCPCNHQGSSVTNGTVDHCRIKTCRAGAAVMECAERTASYLWRCAPWNVCNVCTASYLWRCAPWNVCNVYTASYLRRCAPWNVCTV